MHSRANVTTPPVYPYVGPLLREAPIEPTPWTCPSTSLALERLQNELCKLFTHAIYYIGQACRFLKLLIDHKQVQTCIQSALTKHLDRTALCRSSGPSSGAPCLLRRLYLHGNSKRSRCTRSNTHKGSADPRGRAGKGMMPVLADKIATWCKAFSTSSAVSDIPDMMPHAIHNCILCQVKRIIIAFCLPEYEIKLDACCPVPIFRMPV